MSGISDEIIIGSLVPKRQLKLRKIQISPIELLMNYCEENSVLKVSCVEQEGLPLRSKYLTVSFFLKFIMTNLFLK